jgi:hypothetical protein
MAFKEKVLKCIVELGKEQTIKEIADSIATRALIEAKDNIYDTIKAIEDKKNKELIKALDGWEKEIRESVRNIIKEEIKNGK